MVQQIEEVGVGIVWAENAFYHSDSIQKYLESVRPTSGGPPTDPEKPGQLSDDVLAALEKDAKEPIQDKLRRPWSPWWLLECMPLSKHYFTETGEEWKRWSYVRYSICALRLLTLACQDQLWG